MLDIFTHFEDIDFNLDTLLIFEVHVLPKLGDQTDCKNNQNRYHNGYKVQRSSKKAIEKSEGENSLSSIKWKSYGWSFIEIFSNRNDLRAGLLKVPLYLPPLKAKINMRHFRNNILRVPDTFICMRVDYSDEEQTIKCDPSYFHIYSVPKVHKAFAKEKPLASKKQEYDPSNKIKGLKINIDFAAGYSPKRKVRVLVCLQYNRDLV